MSIKTEQGYYTTVKMMTTKSFKRRRQIQAEPGWRAVMCEIAGETYTLRLVPLVAWGMTRRGKEPIIDDDGDAVMLGELKSTAKFIEEDWVAQAEEAVRERQQFLDLNAMRRNHEEALHQQRLNPC